MMEYRNKSSACPKSATKSSTTDADQVCPHSTLATRYYGLPTIKIRPSHQAPQDVDQEFKAYILGMPSPEGTHPLAFLEVSICCVT